MFSKKNKSRWLSIMGVRRNISITRYDDSYIKTMPPVFQSVIFGQFVDMSKNSTVGKYSRDLKRISLLDNSRVTRRHELQHAVNHYASIYPACAKCLPISVRVTAFFMKQKTRHLNAIGLILNETIAHWVDGNKKFFFKPDDYYVKQVSLLSLPIAYLWEFSYPIVLAFLYTSLYILIQILVSFTIGLVK